MVLLSQLSDATLLLPLALALLNASCVMMVLILYVVSIAMLLSLLILPKRIVLFKFTLE